jgi:DNA-binding response OmpR family regulator
MTRPCRILLVDDSEHDVFFFHEAKKRAAVTFPVEVVSDGVAAISYLSGDPPYSDRTRFPLPSIILLDLKLPKKSGHEVLEWLKADSNFRDIQVLILSSSFEEADVRRAYDLGAALYIVKPVGLNILTNLIRAIAGYCHDPEGGTPKDLAAFALPRPRSA